MKTVHLDMTVDQARAQSRACELYLRMALGQFGYLEELVRMGALTPKTELSLEQHNEMRDLMDSFSRIFGHSANASYGVGHENVSDQAHRCYEIQKVIDKAVAEDEDPNPTFRSVRYDGLLVRYTQDPAPVAHVADGELGEIVVTSNEAGECVLVSRQDAEGRILSVIWEKALKGE